MPLNLKQRLSDFLRQAKQTESFQVALFPLNTVLFPGGKLALKVFEPRYLEMLGECMKESKPFGVVLIREGLESGPPALPERTGCLVEILDWDMAEMGVLKITVLGTRRFHAEHLHTRKNGLIVAQAVAVAEEPPLPLPPRHQACAVTLRRIIEHLGEERFAPPMRYDDAVWVGYRLAELLPLKRSARQNMLEMNDSLVRIEILHNFLAQQGLLG